MTPKDELDRAIKALSEKIEKSNREYKSPDKLMELHSMICPTETKEYLSVEYCLKHGYSTI